jgi:sec-independent protein translocase protein TatA
MLGRIGTTEFLVIFGVVLIIFGPQRLPEVGQAMGRALKEFKKATLDLVGDREENEQ